MYNFDVEKSRKRIPLITSIHILTLFTVLLLYLCVFYSEKRFKNKIVVAITVCDLNPTKGLNLIKSIIFFSKLPVHFVIFTERDLRISLLKTLIKWRELTKGQLHYEVHVVKFPKNTPKEWLPFFEVCSSQKLYLPDLLPHIDTLIYLDTNFLFLSPVEVIWSQFYKFNSSHISAMVPEQDLMFHSSGTKNYLGKCGLNAGMVMMNLKRMRQFNWTDKVVSAFKDWKGVLELSGQDIINTIFSSNPNTVKVLPVAYNLRITKCQNEIYGTKICANTSVDNGVFLIGRNKFPTNNSVFKACYKAINKTSIVDKLPFLLFNRMQRFLKNTSLAGCPEEMNAILRFPYESLTKKYKVAGQKTMQNKNTGPSQSLRSSPDVDATMRQRLRKLWL